ncbi:MAG: hypothetical protein QN178_11820 [Armatimonadota bacterium]|nr:hypothetical protein [Armatimonadota bacterium]
MRAGALIALLVMLGTIALPVNAEEKLTVRVAVEPATIYAGDKLKITAKTLPGAVCALSIGLRDQKAVGTAQLTIR